MFLVELVFSTRMISWDFSPTTSSGCTQRSDISSHTQTFTPTSLLTDPLSPFFSGSPFPFFSPLALRLLPPADAQLVPVVISYLAATFVFLSCTHPHILGRWCSHGVTIYGG